MTPGALYRWTDEAAIRTFVMQGDAPATRTKRGWLSTRYGPAARGGGR